MLKLRKEILKTVKDDQDSVEIAVQIAAFIVIVIDVLVLDVLFGHAFLVISVANVEDAYAVDKYVHTVGNYV